MSWGVQAFGRAAAVRTDLAKQFAGQGKCSEPEESVRQAAILLVDAAIAAQDPGAVVEVNASGSQMQSYTTKVVTNNVTIKIEPRSNFLE